MADKIAKKIFIVACIIMMILPIVFFNFSDKKSTAENRNLANFPVIFLNNKFNYKFIRDFQNWLNDNIGFRELLVHNYSKLMYYFFNTTSSDNVLKGKNGWLFYDHRTDGDGIESYKGYNKYDEKTLIKIRNNLIATKEYLKNELGAEFVLYIAPNKNRIYDEYLPDFMGEKAETYRARQLYNYLKENSDINVVYPYKELMEAKSYIDNNIYYKTDTHWNYTGGYIGAKELLKAVNIVLPDIDGKIVKSVKKDNVSGDLSGMIGMKKDLINVDNEFMVEGFDDNNVKNINSDYYGMIEFESEAENDINMYIISDSFATAMNKYIGTQVHHLWSRKASSFDKKELLKLKPNVIIKELVERKLGQINSFKITE